MKLKLFLAGVGVLTALVVASIFFLKWHAETNYNHGVADTELIYQNQLDLERSKVRQREAEIDDINSQLLDALEAIPTKTETEREVKDNVTTEQAHNIMCRPTRGVVSVFNVSRGYPVGTAENPRLTEEERREASTIEYGTLLGLCAEGFRKFETLRVRFDKLNRAVDKIYKSNE